MTIVAFTTHPSDHNLALVAPCIERFLALPEASRKAHNMSTLPATPAVTLGPQIFCFACANQIDARAEICPRCGVRQLTAQAAKSPKSRPTAAALALLLGSFGAHKFYMGKMAIGALYLVFCWTYIPGLIGWIEGITYLHKSDESWATETGTPVQAADRTAIAILWVVAILPIILILAIIPLLFLGGQVSRIR